MLQHAYEDESADDNQRDASSALGDGIGIEGDQKERLGNSVTPIDR